MDIPFDHLVNCTCSLHGRLGITIGDVWYGGAFVQLVDPKAKRTASVELQARS